MKNLKYDLLYLKKTSKFIIFPSIAVLFAIISPLTAKYINELLKLLMDEGGPVISLPDPTVLDSYAQYISNLYEIFLIVIIFIATSMFIRDKVKGYLPLILSKPINRTKYLLSKYASMSIVIFSSLIVSGIVFSYYTFFVFGEVNVVFVILITLMFMLYVLFIMAIVMLFSTLFNNYAATSLISFFLYILFNILGGFEKSILEYLPGRLMIRMSEILLDISEPSVVIWNVVVTLFMTGLMLFGSIVSFKKYDLK